MSYSNNVTGWFSQLDFAALESLAKSVPLGGHIVEIGSHFGRTTVAWADNVDPSISIWAIDPWDAMTDKDMRFKGMDNIDSLYMSYELSMIHRFDVFRHFTKSYPNIKPIHALSPQSFSYYPHLLDCMPAQADLIFIDAVHTDPGFSADIEFWLPRLKKGGTLCGHDYANWYPDIQAKTNEIANRTGMKLTVPARLGCTVWWMRDLSPVAE